jgi:hypothetical protein
MSPNQKRVAGRHDLVAPARVKVLADGLAFRDLVFGFLAVRSRRP